MTKVLMTAGCSFSECESEWIDTWPRHLAKNFTNHISLGRGSVGNGYISRAVIHEVSRTNPDVVAIMWSGWDRIDLRLEQLEYKNTDAENQYNIRKGNDWPAYPVTWDQLSIDIQSEIQTQFPNLKLLLKNPAHNLRQGFSDKQYWTNISMLLDSGLDSKKYGKAYFTLYSDNISKQIYSLEHILRTQWFLESKKVPYFMMSMNNDVLNLQITDETAHLINMLDRSKFIDCPGMIEWTMKNFGKKGFPKYPDMHPGTQQHNEFTQKVILPYMENKCLL